jgi:hypothetical protein
VSSSFNPRPMWLEVILILIMVVLSTLSCPVECACEGVTVGVAASESLRSTRVLGRPSELHFINRGDVKLDLFLVQHSREEMLVGVLDAWLQMG